MSISAESIVRDPAPDAPGLTLQLISFLAVGGFAALGYFTLSLLAISLATGIPDWLMSAACYALFIVPVYLAHRRFSFRSDTPHGVALPRYAAVQLSALCLAAFFSYVCYSFLGLATVQAAILVTGLTSGVNFIVLKLWAFARRT